MSSEVGPVKADIHDTVDCEPAYVTVDGGHDAVPAVSYGWHGEDGRA